MTVRRRPTARRPRALLAAALAVLLLPAAALPPAAAAVAGPGGGEVVDVEESAEPGPAEPEPAEEAPDGRQWAGGDIVLELTEGIDVIDFTTTYCRMFLPADWVSLQWSTGFAWGDLEQRSLGAQNCETFHWQLGSAVREATGFYRVVSWRGASIVDTQAITVLIRLQPPVVTTEPADRTVALGERAELTSSAAATDPAATTHWESSPDGRTWTAIPEATGTSYLTPPATAEADGTRYRAVHSRTLLAAPFVLPGIASSRAATLTVRSAPVIDPQPVDAEVPVGGTAVFEAGATGFPAPTMRWEQQRPGGAWTAVPGATSGRLEVRDVAREMDGTRYQAVFSNAAGTRTSDVVRLTVLVPPEITEEPEPVRVLVGGTAVFEAAASGVPEPTGQWQWRSARGSWVPLPGATENRLELRDVTAAMDQNRYRAEFRNTLGEQVRSREVTLTVVVVPPVHLTVDAGVRRVAALPGW